MSVSSTAFCQTVYSRLIASGMEHLGRGDYGAARDAFEQAVKVEERGYEARLGLGTVYYHLREDRLSERELRLASELNPENPVPYQILGELYYRMDDLDSAITCWERAVQLGSSNERLKARLERIRREHRAEKDFNRDVTSHFLVKYEGRERIEAGRIVLRILEEAYGDIGRRLSFYPAHEIQVILYSERQFQEVTDAPGWSGGIYDGKIRIPIAGIEQETPGLRRLLYHEYTHAVVRSITPRVPTWLNEGLAQYFEGREILASEQRLLKGILQAGGLPRLEDLEGSFLGFKEGQAALAYLVSLSATRFMIDRFGMYRITGMLEDLGRGSDIAKAMDRNILLSYEEFDRQWRGSIE